MNRFCEPEIIAELRDGGRLGVTVTELKKYMGPIIDFVRQHDRELYVTRHGAVIAKLVPYKSEESEFS